MRALRNSPSWLSPASPPWPLSADGAMKSLRREAERGRKSLREGGSSAPPFPLKTHPLPLECVCGGGTNNTQGEGCGVGVGPGRLA
jgi:hypothetical protein